MTEGERSALALEFVDNLLAGDVDRLHAATDPLRDAIAHSDGEEKGWLTGLLAMHRHALNRLPSNEELELARDGLSARFLRALGLGPAYGGELIHAVNTSPSGVSRVGRILLAKGLVVQRRLGREAVWELTPRGRALIAKSDLDVKR